MDKEIFELIKTILEAPFKTDKAAITTFIETHPIYTPLRKEIAKKLNTKIDEDTPMHYALKMGVSSALLAALLDISIEIFQEILKNTSNNPLNNSLNSLLDKVDNLHKKEPNQEYLTRDYLAYDVVNNRHDREGSSLLHIACSLGDIDNIQLLLDQYNADINRHSRYFRKTPLHFALEHQQFAAAKYLLSRSECSAFAVDMNNRSALFYALSASPLDQELIKLILEKAKTETWAWNADVLNYSDNLGKTIAHYLFRIGNLTLIKDILQLEDTCGKNILEGLRLNSKDKQGLTPAEEAMYSGNPEVLNLLKAIDHGSEV